MTSGCHNIYGNKVYRSGSNVWGYIVVVKSIVKTIEFREVVITIEKLMRCIVEEAHLAGHDKKSGLLTVTLIVYINVNLMLVYTITTIKKLESLL